MAYQIRATTPEDAVDILELLKRSWPAAPSQLAHLHWKYWQPRADWTTPRSFILAKNGIIVAHAGVIPGIYADASHRLRLLHMIDWVARPEAVGAGVVLLKHVQGIADGLLAVGGSAQTLSILPRIGASPRGTVASYVRVLRPLRRLTADPRPTWRVLPRFLRGVYWQLSAPSVIPGGWTSRPVRDAELGNIPLPTARNEFAVMERSAESFRHLLTCPIARFEMYALEKSSGVRGYCLLAFVPGQARLADCWTDSSDVADWSSVLHCAVHLAQQDPLVAEIVASASDPLLCHALRGTGFHRRFSLPVHTLSSAASARVGPSIRIQMSDSDAAYLHSGTSDFLS
jgi:hypothetical protein